MRDAGGLDGRDAVAEGLQAGGLAVRDPIVNAHQRNLGEEGPLGETAGKLKADDRSLAAEVVLALEAERAGAAGQFRPRRHAIARPNPRDAFSDLDDSGAEFMAEKLHGGLGLEPALDGLIGEGRDAEGELGLGDAGLHAERFGDHVARPADRLRDVVEPHVAETVESPGFHDRLLTQAGEFLKRVAVGGNRASIAARRPGHLADVEVAPRIEAEVMGCVEVAGGTRV